MQLKSLMAKKCGVVKESTSNKHTKTAVEIDVIVTDLVVEAEDHHQTTNALLAERPVIGKNFSKLWILDEMASTGSDLGRIDEMMQKTWESDQTTGIWEKLK